jgi:hypothetical protein
LRYAKALLIFVQAAAENVSGGPCTCAFVCVLPSGNTNHLLLHPQNLSQLHHNQILGIAGLLFLLKRNRKPRLISDGVCQLSETWK